MKTHHIMSRNFHQADPFSARRFSGEAYSICKRGLFSAKLVVLVGCIALALPAWSSNKKQVLRKLDDRSYAALSFKRGLHLDVRVERAQDLAAAVRDYTGAFDDPNFSFAKRRVAKINATRALIPFTALSPLFQKSVIHTLWPKDALKGDVWIHYVVYAGHETLWSISEWFTGAGKNYRAIKRASGRRSDRINTGLRLKIPKQLLIDILGAPPLTDVPRVEDPVFAIQTQLQATETVVKEEDPVPVVSPPSGPDKQPAQASPAAKPKSQDRKKDNGDSANQQSPAFLKAMEELNEIRRELAYGSDGQGPYVEYKLKAGEAIYSAVVVRFCGLVRADDVNRVAELIIKRNRIRDETDLPIGKPIRIPQEYVEPEFKAAGDPEFLAYLENLEKVSGMSMDLAAKNLEGVYIILDAGHGGRDPGAHFGWVWEDDYVYDIVCRVKQRLEVETAAKVITTVVDPSVRYKVQNVQRFRRDQDEVLLTTPRFPLSSPRVSQDGVNLRWMLANHRFENLIKQGVKPENILFASFHADSLHRSLRGAMVYVPDARVYPRKLPGISRFKRYKEFQGSQRGFNQRSARESQALSTNFAKHFIQKTRGQGVRVHRQKPIRTLIYRNPSRPYVPAVINYNRVPTRCLIEVCNLNNKGDRELLRRHQFRQQIADAFVEALFQTYSVPVASTVSSPPQTASRAE